MTDTTRSHQNQVENEASTIMKRVAGVARSYELVAIRFVDCQFSYLKRDDGLEDEVRLGVRDQEVSLDGNVLKTSMLFEFAAPSPFEEEEEKKKKVIIRARLYLEYVAQANHTGTEPADADLFGRVNGLYNAWPYLREYVRACLARLGLPPFDLPLLRAPEAAQLAGVIPLPAQQASVQDTRSKSD